VVNFVNLADAVPSVDKAPNPCHAQDMPAGTGLPHTLEAVLSSTLKLHSFVPQNRAEAETLLEMVAIAHGGQLSTGRPLFTFGVSMTSPLLLDHDSADIVMFMARKRIPFITAPCPMGRGTSPSSLLGTLLMQTAENLALITMAQCVEQGCPLAMGDVGGRMDMRFAVLAYGAPERSLLIAANN